MPPPEIAVTGIGAVSGFGLGTAALWAGLSTGTSAIRRLDPFPPHFGQPPVTIGAPAPTFLRGAPADAPGRAAAMAWLAATEALAHASQPDPATLALTGAIGWPEQTPQSLSPFALSQSLDWLAAQLRLGGSRRACLSACAASTQAIGDAVRWIRSGRVIRCLVVGADTRLHPAGIFGYARLGALETRFSSRPTAASRPFDAHRGGFVIGEGAGALVLEDATAARQRGAPILAFIRGHATTADAYRLTDPEPEGQSAARCLCQALVDAAIQPHQVDYLNLHGTGTPANDTAEAAALRLALGPALRTIPAGSFKSMTGHLAMAAGALETVGTILALRHRLLPPNLNLETPDPACAGPDYLGNTPRPAAIRHALKSSQGFGGQNASLVLEASTP